MSDQLILPVGEDSRSLKLILASERACDTEPIDAGVREGI